ncbi:Zinc finger CCHC-type protein [Dioscorea alata]|uniref:Zinc finger CCHC-type protein n=1 Tax=Dioscorea alata TaxID=55571 RepID=A0ACB7WVF6_DIOAL|nr:Zinc finger CCHC-type protein [Dioscorea alata]
MMRRPPGRPHKSRRKETDEPTVSQTKVSRKGVQLNCRKCGKTGHNIRTCKGEVGSNRRLPKLAVRRVVGETPRQVGDVGGKERVEVSAFQKPRRACRRNQRQPSTSKSQNVDVGCGDRVNVGALEKARAGATSQMKPSTSKGSTQQRQAKIVSTREIMETNTTKKICRPTSVNRPLTQPPEFTLRWMPDVGF